MWRGVWVAGRSGSAGFTPCQGGHPPHPHRSFRVHSVALRAGPTEEDAKKALKSAPYNDAPAPPLDDAPFTYTRVVRALDARTLASLAERLKKTHTPEGLAAAVEAAGAVEVMQPVLLVPTGCTWLSSGAAQVRVFA